MKNTLHNILQVNTADIGGGAEKIAWDLHQGYRARDHHAWLAVGQKRSGDPTVLEISHDQYRAFWMKVAKSFAETSLPIPARLRKTCSHLAKFHHRRAKKLGHEHFYFPGTRHLVELPPEKPDVLHGHNLHGKYFDLRVLPVLSSRLPVMLTLHDTWMLSGYCTYSFGCERWRTGCGQCPLVHTFRVERDGTDFNWKRKRDLYAKSRLYIATPSQWLMDLVEHSMLAPGIVERRVIYNGVELSVFCPGDQNTIRAELGLPVDIPVIISTAARIGHDPRKDYQTMREAMLILRQKTADHPVHFVALGGEQPAEKVGQTTIQFVPFQRDVTAVARYYQAADMYIHAAKADNLPNTVSEALACGTPVVAMTVGGIPEQVDNGKTGFLVPPGDPEAMASAIQQMLQNADLHRQMSIEAAETAKQRFDVNRMIEDYLAWYQEILSSEEKR